ncbi:MAG: Na(+)/H(+) antiporter subunit D [Desulfatibacillum sp.]|nr:Na(+)/H(+) antiporter subunit D [Desulfatibacillum sp.]
MIPDIPPGILLICGAFLTPFLRGGARKAWLLILPLTALAVVIAAPEGTRWTVDFLGQKLILFHMDRLSRVFGIIFTLITAIGFLFALRVEDTLQHTAALVYAGSALGVTFAGDFFSLYVYWEFMAISSTFLVLARRTPEARAAAFRYILVHLAGGLVLLAGIVLLFSQTGSLAVRHIGLNGSASWLLFLGIAVNAAIPPLHPWLKDAYPQATATGAVFLSAFTTKSAVYLMARTFSGTELLIWLGAIMTFVPIFYAVLENDIRSVLSYSLINQVGFMMCGVGIGTQLAINGTVAHAFCHILYKALLFMAAGSVLHVTGRIRCTDLGGLYKTMPITCLFCIVGAASISAFPFFSGFISKSMIVSAAGYGHLAVVWLMLQFASAGVFHHAGIKVPYFMFFSHDRGIDAKEPPLNMLLAMGIAAFVCVAVGVYPKPLYAILPYPVDYVPYTATHVVSQLQLLLFGALAFALLMLSGVYPPEIRAINLDVDWFYRKGARAADKALSTVLNKANKMADGLFFQFIPGCAARFSSNAPSRLVGIPLACFFWLMGCRGQYLEFRMDSMRKSIEKESLPVGWAAAAIALMLVFLYIWN